MKLRKVAGGCEEGECPTVHVTDRGTLIFQGDAVTTGLPLGPGEQAVELRPELLREALMALGGRFGLPTDV